ncbi:LlaJI family restriction endonuclease [Bacteroides acidifaciens]|uniref:LlaJI family restriction endonuclease n=1 Tax=Bacteroides acidifaciens TaxID=85831 RepID=UPI0026282ADA|nr:LlaJI family restriction endonuclease [Bacteroides acidifaciens]
MKILVEEHTYSNATQINEICGNFNVLQDNKVSKVGYFFNPTINDCVICLPKVIKDAAGTTVLGGLSPENLINIFSEDEDNQINEIQREFVRNFSLWSYRTISTFHKLNPQSSIVSYASSTRDKIDENNTYGTLLDVIFAIVQFYNKNKDYLIYTIKNLHRGNDRINWRKTISNKTPVFQDNVPIYIDAINKRKQINFDEELMIIFYSTISYISKNLGIRIITEYNYELISGAQFEAYLEGLGLTRLKAIKYKYFSDKDIQLWRLCYAFFEKTSQIEASNNIEDYLLVSDFNQVFESMIDVLISDKDLPDILKNQEDGKIVDHIFRHNSPIDGQPIYYIGDSKYYSIGRNIEDKSLYKQFTYAKNIIQYHFITKKRNKLESIRYRDNLTEGYNFTPNFFISAYIPSELNYDSTEIKERKFDDNKHRISHFENRLFDRDTLWLTHFDVNLLFIMMLYAENDNISQSSFKSELIIKVFKSFQDILTAKYDFYIISAKEKSLEVFVKTHFMLLNGKIYTLANGALLLALEKDADESDRVRTIVKKNADLTSIKLAEITTT